MAAALVVIGFANLYADGGIGAAVVRSPACDDSLLRSAFTLQMLIGAVCATAITLAADHAGSLLRQPMLPDVLRVLSVLFVIQAFGDTSESVLRRRLDFRRLQLAFVGSYLFGYGGIGITLAVREAGVWSLVFAHLAQAAAYSIATYAMVRHPIRPTRRGSIGLFRFGASVMAVNTANWVLSNADNLAVARYFGAVGLGIYSRAFNLVYAPIQTVVVTVQQVLFPMYARAALKGEGTRSVYLSSVNGIALCMIPTFLATACVAKTIVMGLYGAKWTDAAGVLVPLALSMPFYAVMGMAGPVLWGRGEAFREFRIQAVVASVFALGLTIAVRHSAVAIAWSVLAINAGRSVLMTGAAMKALEIPSRDLARCIKGPIVLGIVTAFMVGSLDRALGLFSMLPEVRLLMLVVVGLGSVGVALRQVPTFFMISESRPYLRKVPWIADRRGRGTMPVTREGEYMDG